MELAVINFVLKNTFENNIHQMREGTKNLVFVNTKGDKKEFPEAVYSPDSQLVKNDNNQGPFNYHITELAPLKHFATIFFPGLNGETPERTRLPLKNDYIIIPWI